MKTQKFKIAEPPLVSIIMPTYNNEEWIFDSVMSALNQSYKNIELIIVDDGSTDNTESIINKITSPKLKYYKTENKGASAARNFGFQKSSGQYIQYLDSDDILESDKIELQLQKMLANDADICFGIWKDLTLNEKINKEFKFKKTNFLNIQTGKEMIKSFGMDNWFVITFSWLTKRSAIKLAGPWDENLSNNDDGEFFYRVLFNADKLVCVNEVLGHYRVILADSLSNYNNKDKVDSAYRSYKKIEQHMIKENQLDLLCYPKRQYYVQYRMLTRQFPSLAKRAAESFDSIDGPCFLIKKKKFWWCVHNFGLIKGIAIYEKLMKGIGIYKNLY